VYYSSIHLEEDDSSSSEDEIRDDTSPNDSVKVTNNQIAEVTIDDNQLPKLVKFNEISEPTRRATIEGKLTRRRAEGGRLSNIMEL
jgi:hypothetical protein